MDLLKLLNLNEIIAQLITFFIILFFLKKFLWGRLLKVLDERRDRIAGEFKNIETSKDEVSKIRLEYENKLKEIENEARKRIQSAVEEGRKIQEQIRKEAQLESLNIIENARVYLKAELIKVKEELKNDIVNLSIRIAEEIVESRLTCEDDKKLVENFLLDLEKTPNDKK